MNPKKKGNRGENNWANWLIDNGIKAWRDNQSGGGDREKSDVGNSINCHFEIKTVKKLNVKQAWKQAEENSLKTKTTPHLVIHFDGMPEDKWLIVMDNYDWLELIRGEKKVATDYHDPSKKYRLLRLIDAIKAVVKDYEGYHNF